MPYKRFVGRVWPFTIPQNHAVLVNIDFFNSHAILHQLTRRQVKRAPCDSDILPKASFWER
jgi:hypothetical protein